MPGDDLTCEHCCKPLGEQVYCRDCLDEQVAFKKALLDSQARLTAEIRYLRDAMHGLVNPNGESPVRQEEVDEILARADRIGAGQETFPRPLEGAQALMPEQVSKLSRCTKCGCTDGMHYGWCK